MLKWMKLCAQFWVSVWVVCVCVYSRSIAPKAFETRWKHTATCLEVYCVSKCRCKHCRTLFHSNPYWNWNLMCFYVELLPRAYALLRTLTHIISRHTVYPMNSPAVPLCGCFWWENHCHRCQNILAWLQVWAQRSKVTGMVSEWEREREWDRKHTLSADTHFNSFCIWINCHSLRSTVKRWKARKTHIYRPNKM